MGSFRPSQQTFREVVNESADMSEYDEVMRLSNQADRYASLNPLVLVQIENNDKQENSNKKGQIWSVAWRWPPWPSFKEPVGATGQPESVTQLQEF